MVRGNSLNILRMFCVLCIPWGNSFGCQCDKVASVALRERRPLKERKEGETQEII